MKNIIKGCMPAAAIFGLVLVGGAAVLSLGFGDDGGQKRHGDAGTYHGVPHVAGLGNASLPLVPTSVDDEQRLIPETDREDGPLTYCGAAEPPPGEEPLRFSAAEAPAEGPPSTFVEGPEGEPIDEGAIPEGNWSYARWGEAEAGERPLLFIVTNRGLDHELATKGLIVFSAYSPYQCATVTIPEPGDPVPGPRAPPSVNLSALAFDPTHLGFWLLDGLTTDRVDELPDARIH